MQEIMASEPDKRRRAAVQPKAKGIFIFQENLNLTP